MDGAFQFSVDPARNLIRTRLTGFFSPDDFQRYLVARAAAFRELRCRPNQHLSLTDVREMKIQSKEMVAAFGTMLAEPAYRSRRLGFVVAGTLALMQLERALGPRAGNDARCFTDPEAAERWVLTGVDAEAA